MWDPVYAEAALLLTPAVLGVLGFLAFCVILALGPKAVRYPQHWPDWPIAVLGFGSLALAFFGSMLISVVAS